MQFRRAEAIRKPEPNLVPAKRQMYDLAQRGIADVRSRKRIGWLYQLLRCSPGSDPMGLRFAKVSRISQSGKQENRSESQRQAQTLQSLESFIWEGLKLGGRIEIHEEMGPCDMS